MNLKMGSGKEKKIEEVGKTKPLAESRLLNLSSSARKVVDDKDFGLKSSTARSGLTDPQKRAFSEKLEGSLKGNVFDAWFMLNSIVRGEDLDEQGRWIASLIQVYREADEPGQVAGERETIYINRGDVEYCTKLVSRRLKELDLELPEPVPGSMTADEESKEQYAEFRTKGVKQQSLWWITSQHPDASVVDLAHEILSGGVVLGKTNPESTDFSSELRILKKFLDAAAQANSSDRKGVEELAGFLSEEKERYSYTDGPPNLIQAFIDLIRDQDCRGFIEGASEIPSDVVNEVLRKSSNPVTVVAMSLRPQLRETLLRDHGKSIVLANNHPAAFSQLLERDRQNPGEVTGLLERVMDLDDPSHILDALGRSRLAPTLLEDPGRLISLLESPGILKNLVDLDSKRYMIRDSTWGGFIASRLGFLESVIESMEDKSLEDVVDDIAAVTRRDKFEPLREPFAKFIDDRGSSECLEILNGLPGIKSREQAERLARRLGFGRPLGKGGTGPATVSRLEKPFYSAEGKLERPLALGMFHYLGGEESVKPGPHGKFKGMDELLRSPELSVCEALDRKISNAAKEGIQSELEDNGDRALSKLELLAEIHSTLLKRKVKGIDPDGVVLSLVENFSHENLDLDLVHDFVKGGKKPHAARLYALALSDEGYRDRLGEVVEALGLFENKDLKKVEGLDQLI